MRLIHAVREINAGTDAPHEAMRRAARRESQSNGALMRGGSIGLRFSSSPDIAAQRAKQLRRGAVNRLLAGSPEGSDVHQPHKAERIAMEEVRRGFISYDLPELKAPQSKAEGQV